MSDRVTDSEVLEALELQHKAIDILFAMVINLTSKDKEMFLPSKSGSLWDAAVKGNNVIERLKEEAKNV